MNFVPVTQKVGPDGALYVSDWSDKQVCHRGSNAIEMWDRSNGRIYRVSYAGWKPWKGDLSKESDAALAKSAVQTENEWLSRMARRVLTERCVGNLAALDTVVKAIADFSLAPDFESHRQLKTMWLVQSAHGAARWNNAQKGSVGIPGAVPNETTPPVR
eukprot:gene14370-17553_t